MAVIIQNKKIRCGYRKAHRVGDLLKIINMNLKLLVLTFIIGFAFASCSNEKSDSNSLVKKRIIQKIETDAMGMIKDLKIVNIEKLNDTTFRGIHTFSNPMFNKEVRITRNYIFTIDLDSITKKEDIKTEMKSEGKWVKTGF